MLALALAEVPESVSSLILAPCTAQSGPSVVPAADGGPPPFSRVYEKTLPPLESLHDVDPSRAFTVTSSMAPIAVLDTCLRLPRVWVDLEAA